MNCKNFLKENKLLIIATIFVVIIFSLFIFYSNERKEVNIKIAQIQEKKKIDYQPIIDSIKAKSFYVYDILEQKPIFSKDEHLKLPLASIAKLMSGLVILDIMPETTIVTIGKEDIA